MPGSIDGWSRRRATRSGGGSRGRVACRTIRPSSRPSSPARPRRPRPAHRARRAAAADSPARGPAGRRAQGPRPGSRRPDSWSITSARRSSAAEPRNGASCASDGRDALPGRQEPRERGRVRPAPPRGGAAPASAVGAGRRTSGSHHSRSAAARSELATDQRSRRDQPRRARPRRPRSAGPSGAPAPASGTDRGCGRSARADPRARAVAGARNASGTPAGGDRAHAVPVPRDVLDRDPALLAADPEPDGASGRRAAPRATAAATA